ncbi:MAG TPA: hypothetical protein VM186_01060, partial [Planctomycetota bacterium]|nr:hypothetical protein [Planctomycetota bacterium]
IARPTQPEIGRTIPAARVASWCCIPHRFPEPPEVRPYMRATGKLHTPRACSLSLPYHTAFPVENTIDLIYNTEGIMRSTRRIPVDIPKSKIICSSIEKLDPKKQLKEAGYPFDHIATELIDLHGKFEVVSSDVRLMKDEFNKKTAALSDKIEVETRLLASKIDDTPKNVLDKVETLFDRKFLRVVGVVLGGVSMLYGGVTYLQGTTLGGEAVAFIALVVGSALMLLTYFLSRK